MSPEDTTRMSLTDGTHQSLWYDNLELYVSQGFGYMAADLRSGG